MANNYMFNYIINSYLLYSYNIRYRLEIYYANVYSNCYSSNHCHQCGSCFYINSSKTFMLNMHHLPRKFADFLQNQKIKTVFRAFYVVLIGIK